MIVFASTANNKGNPQLKYYIYYVMPNCNSVFTKK